MITGRTATAADPAKAQLLALARREHVPADATNERKRVANLAAGLKLAGYQFHELKSGEFLISKWGLQRFCKTLAEAEGFAWQAGAIE